jgi:hypothetical protein
MFKLKGGNMMKRDHSSTQFALKHAQKVSARVLMSKYVIRIVFGAIRSFVVVVCCWFVKNLIFILLYMFKMYVYVSLCLCVYM